jgi:hypothetical protein
MSIEGLGDLIDDATDDTAVLRIMGKYIGSEVTTVGLAGLVFDESLLDEGWRKRLPQGTSLMRQPGADINDGRRVADTGESGRAGAAFFTLMPAF